MVGVLALTKVLDPAGVLKNKKLVPENENDSRIGKLGEGNSLTSQKDVNVREFVHHKSRGILINGADGSRNAAFKVETINNIFSQI